MKKKLPKSKRPTHFLRPKKSSTLLPGSIKKTPKRKIKHIAKKIAIRSIIFFSLFIVSLGILWVASLRTTQLLNPVPFVSNVLGVSTQHQTNAALFQIKDALQKHSIAFSDVSVQGNDILVQLSDGTEVLFSATRDVTEQIDSLQLTMDNLTIEGKHISRIDMRFDRPVVTFQ